MTKQTLERIRTRLSKHEGREIRPEDMIVLLSETNAIGTVHIFTYKRPRFSKYANIRNKRG
jgi:hypothetical protein